MDSNNTVFVIDGGFSTQLSKYATNFDNHPLWSSYLLYENPKLVFQTHLDYIKAGADIIQTNTYQASIEGFKKYLNNKLTNEQCIELIERAVILAKDARKCYLEDTKSKRKILIAGSVGPYGAYLHDGSEYNGNYCKTTPMEEIKSWHKPRIEALINAGVDLLAFETLPASAEAEMLVELLKEYPNTKAWVSFSCKDGSHNNSGEDFQMVAKKCYDLNPEQIFAVGVNCTNTEYVESLFRGFNADRNNPIPLLVYSQSGETFDKDKGWTNKEQCKPIESYIKTWFDLGIKYIGGCCRIDAENIAKIRERVDELNKTNI